MHSLKNMLNLNLTQLESNVNVINATKHGYISDHCMVSIDFHLHKLRYPKIEKTIRDKTKIIVEALLINFNAPTIDHKNSLDHGCHPLNAELLNALHRITPLKPIKYSNKPRQPWFNKYIRDQMKIVSSGQKPWNKCKQPHHQTAYTTERNIHK